jgi:hypothetical protein
LATLPLVLSDFGAFIQKGDSYQFLLHLRWIQFGDLPILNGIIDKNKLKLKQIIMDFKRNSKRIKFVANSGVAEVN